MSSGFRSSHAATVLALVCGMSSAAAYASLSARNEPLTGFAATAATEYARFLRMTTGVREVVLATKAAGDSQRRARQAGAARGKAPLIAVTAPGAGQAGYVHYFLLRLPDETLEIQVGIELADQRIAWSFPDVGPVVSEFIDAGVVPAGGKEYEVWHLYGLRPCPDDGAMAALQKALPGRVRSLTERNISYCENDGPQSRCMSCLGFVLRVLFPGRSNAYPDVPREFWRAGTASRYTTRDLLLYLSGMLDLPTREARLKRIGRLDVPDVLRDDLEALVYSMSPAEAAPVSKSVTAGETVQKRSGARSASAGARNAPRKKL
ncbi:MAG: hypothetical protein K0R53_2620 [Burkholderiales bacterium]|nr:hypothetical protein [Burkholderiales bacterium]